MLNLRHSPAILTKRLDFIKISINKPNNLVLCAQKGPRPRYPRVWKTNKKIGTISKSLKLLECIKGLSNVKEEVYGALDSFIAWDLEFPLITVKKALKTLEHEQEWKRIIQVTKWMLSKGQGRTMGSYFTLLNALAEDDRLEEVEELWTKLFSEHLEAVPRTFFDKMISIYYQKGMHDKMFEVFADMEELSVRPNTSIIKKVGDVFQKLGMFDKYEKLHYKYPPPKWEYRYIKGKRIRLRAQYLQKFDETHKRKGSTKEPNNELLNKVDEEEEESSLLDEFEEPNNLLSGSKEENNDHLNKVDEQEENSLLGEFEEPNNLLSGSNEENNDLLNKVDEQEENSLLGEFEEPNKLLSGSNEENNDLLNKVDEEENHPLNEFEELNGRLSESNEENSEHMNKADEEENNLLVELEEANQCSNEFDIEAGTDSS